MTMDTITTLLVGGIISSLLTSFIHTLNSRKIIKEVVTEVIHNHEKQYHIENPSKNLQDHIVNCQSNNRIIKIEKALIYIVCQIGGNPKELGLVNLQSNMPGIDL